MQWRERSVRSVKQEQETLLDVQVTPSSTQMVHQADPRRWLMLAIVLCATLMGVLDAFIVNVAMPSIKLELHASFAEVQLVSAGYTLAYAVLLVTGGRLGDLYGRKRLFLLGAGGFTLLSLLCGFAPSPLLLIVYRIAQGSMAALMVPQVISIIQVSFDPQERPLALSAYATVNALASILGQVFGGLLLGLNIFHVGWRSIFLVNVPIGMVSLLAAVPLLHESRSREARNLDYGGVVLLTSSLFLLIFPLVMGQSADWPLWAIFCLLVSVPCMIAFLIYEHQMTRRGKTPLVSLELFRITRFATGIITILLISVLFAPILFLLPFYLQTILHFTPFQAGLVFMAASIAVLIASSTNTVLVQRLGRWSLSVAAALVTIGYLLVFLSVKFLVLLWGVLPLLIALFVLGFGMGLLGTPLLHRTLEGVTHDDVGIASGIYFTALQTASALGVAIVGMVFATLATRSGGAVHALVISLLVVTLLSLGHSLTVLPLSRAYASDED